MEKLTKLKKFLMGTTFVLYAVLLFFIAYFSYRIKIYEFFPLEFYFFFGLTYIPIFFFLANSTIKKRHYILAGLLIVLAFASYPSTSVDPFHYLFDGQLIRIFKLSPYLAIPTQFPVDQYLTVFKDAWWANYPSAYGPAWEFLMAIINFISGNTALIGIICLKLLGLIFLIISTKLIFKLNNNKSLAWLFLINPIVLTNTIQTPHPDIILLAFILLPFLNLNAIKSSLSLSVASLIKINSIIFVPFWIGREKIVKKLLIFAICLIALIVFFQLTLKLNFIDMLKASWSATYPLKKEALMSIILPKSIASKSNLIINISFIITYAVIYVLFIKKKINALKACLLVSFLSPILMANIYPWHYLIFIGLLFASESYMLILLLISCLLFLAPINLFFFPTILIALYVGTKLIFNILKINGINLYEKIEKFKLV